VRLAHLYPDTYKQLLSEQRSFDEQEGATWSIAGDSKLSITVHTRANAVPVFDTDTRDQGENEGNNGGET
jgi:hypothetical protein